MLSFTKSFRDKRGDWDSESLSADQAVAALKANDSFAAFGTPSEIVTLRAALISKGIVCGEPTEVKGGRSRLAINPVGIGADAFLAMLD